MSRRADLVNKGALSGVTGEPTPAWVLSEVCQHSPLVKTSSLRFCG